MAAVKGWAVCVEAAWSLTAKIWTGVMASRAQNLMGFVWFAELVVEWMKELDEEGDSRLLVFGRLGQWIA